jgi:uncharacterized membrane protein YbhN (UPF0104 family)
MARGLIMRSLGRPSVVLATGTSLLFIGVCVITREDVQDRLRSLGASSQDFLVLFLGLVIVLPLVSVAHYLFAAVALRSASGRPLPWRRAIEAQLAGAATNRVVPNGLGGIGVNLRYLNRSGLSLSSATTAVAALAFAGVVTDLLYTLTVSAGGSAIGFGGATKELKLLAAHGVHAGHQAPWLTIGVAVLARGFAIRKVRDLSAIRGWLREAFSHGRAIVADPRHGVVLMVSSLATSVALSVGFGTVVCCFVGAQSRPTFGGLIALYLLVAAIGGATPLPAFVCVTEVTMVAALTASGVRFGAAVIATIVFRAVSFWGVVPAGIYTGKRLRAAQLL